MSSFKRKLRRTGALEKAGVLHPGPTIDIDDDKRLSEMLEQAWVRRTNQGAPLDGMKFVVKCAHGEWQIILTCAREADPDPRELHHEHWHVSAMLWPVGRASVVEDWHDVGVLVGKLARSSGADVDAILELTDEHEADPSLPRHWCWHVDGSPCVSAEPLRKALRMMHGQLVPSSRVSD